MEPESHVEQLRVWFQQEGEFLSCWLRARLGPAVRRDFDVADLLQEIWIRALRVRSSEPIAHPRAWLLAFARNIVLEVLRSSSRRAVLHGASADGETIDVPDDITSFTQRVARNELRQNFFVALDALEEDDRQLVVQHGLEGRPVAEVAARLGITVDAAHKRWQRLRDRLRSLGSPADLL